MRRFILLGACGLLLLGACAGRYDNRLTQVSTIDSLLAGVYDGHMSLAELRRHGDFGLGTFDRLDGEMILLDGKFYKARSDGKVVRPPLSEKTPFASVTVLSPDKRCKLQEKDFNGLCNLVDGLAPESNQFCAFKVRGFFKMVHVRSVPPQKRPYPPLDFVAKNQPEFEYRDVRGTVVGFRCPKFSKGWNVPGYHIHFLSDDRTLGGHVLGFELREGTLELDVKIDWIDVYLPRSSRDFGNANLEKDRSAELERIEKSRR